MNSKPKDHAYTKHVIVLILFLFCVITIWQSSLIDWDEGVFALQGQWFASLGSQGKPFNFQTPPLFQLIIAGCFMLAGHHWYILPLLSVVAACLTLYVVYALAASFFSREQALFAMMLTASTELFIFFARSGLSDATFLLLFTGAAFFFLRGLKSNRTREFVIAGICTAGALYTKYSALPLCMSFIIIGAINRKSIPRRWFLASVLLPLLLYLPYLVLYAVVVPTPLFAARHGPLVGIHHLAYGHYTVIFAPVILLLALIHLATGKGRRQSGDILIIAGVYFIFVGFYHPYMRLLLPIVPFVAILGARLIARTGKMKIPLIVASVLCSLILSLGTIRYVSGTPRAVAARTVQTCQEEQCRFIYAAVPPNITFFLSGNILIPEDHAWISLGRRCPVLLRNRTIMERSTNALRGETGIVYLHATINDSLKRQHALMFRELSPMWSMDFIDAPLYRKDPYNPLKDIIQSYECYTITADSLPQIMEEIWQFGFEPAVTVIEQ